MKFKCVIDGIDPPLDRPLQTTGQYIEGCEIWAKSTLADLPNDKRHAGAVAIIYEYVVTERKRITRDPILQLPLWDAIEQVVDKVQKGQWDGKYNVVDMAGELREVLHRHNEDK